MDTTLLGEGLGLIVIANRQERMCASFFEIKTMKMPISGSPIEVLIVRTLLPPKPLPP